MERWMPLAAAGVALLVSLGFAGWGLYCGQKTASPSSPGGATGGSACGPYVPAPAWVALGASLAAMASVIWGRWVWTTGVGVVAVGLGVLFALSGGIYTVIVGLVATLAGLLQREAPPKPA